MQLEALTDAAFVHLRGMGKQNSIELEYNVYPRKADMPPDLHKARCVSQWHRNLQLLTVTRFCQVYMSRRIQLAESMWRLRGITREDAAGRYRMLLDNYRFWGAPVGMIVTVDRHLLLAEVFVCMEGQYSTAHSGWFSYCMCTAKAAKVAATGMPGDMQVYSSRALLCWRWSVGLPQHFDIRVGSWLFIFWALSLRW